MSILTPHDSPQALLIVANAYPSQHALYRNGFIHARVLAYVNHGLETKVYYLHPPAKRTYSYEHEGVNVTVGNEDHYRAFLRQNRFRKVLVHFPQRHMVQPIFDTWPDTPIIAWVHGFETEAWHRRWFNFLETAEGIRSALEKEKTYHAPQREFLREFFLDEDHDVTIVQISEWFATRISHPDVGVRPRKEFVIHNFVDGAKFPAVKKDPALRYRVLSVRPYASWKYANDLTVAAVLELSEKPSFDRYKFTICGDGPLFDEVTAPLQERSNVSLRKGFLTQAELSAMHMDHGVLLTPTRFDSQGVSMCEGMSSGLVPLATEIAAIPEFVTHGVSGLLARPENASDLADFMNLLALDPALFERLSEGATRIQEQCGYEATIRKELELIQA